MTKRLVLSLHATEHERQERSGASSAGGGGRRQTRQTPVAMQRKRMMPTKRSWEARLRQCRAAQSARARGGKPPAG
eukprot:1378342-Rhodomonas_salina.1